MGRVTLQDVATAAGVSTATASWAINNNRNARIPQATRERVQQVALKLGYHPNALAKGLARGSSSLIGFISDGVATSPFAGQVIRGAQDEAWRNGKILLIVDTSGKRSIERSAFDFMMEHQVEGIIYSSWVHQAITPPAELHAERDVLVNCFDEGHRFRSVVPDERQGGYSATHLLIEQGHRNIAFLNDPKPSPASTGRLLGYKQALEEAGIAFDESLVIAAASNQEGGYGAADALLNAGVSAAFCHNDRLAMGLYDALHERQVSVPEDISLVGFDNQQVIAAHLHPSLTTIGLPQYELGVLGVRTLLTMHGADADVNSGTGSDDEAAAISNSTSGNADSNVPGTAGTASTSTSTSKNLDLSIPAGSSSAATGSTNVSSGNSVPSAASPADSFTLQDHRSTPAFTTLGNAQLVECPVVERASVRQI